MPPKGARTSGVWQKFKDVALSTGSNNNGTARCIKCSSVIQFTNGPGNLSKHVDSCESKAAPAQSVLSAMKASPAAAAAAAVGAVTVTQGEANEALAVVFGGLSFRLFENDWFRAAFCPTLTPKSIPVAIHALRVLTQAAVLEFLRDKSVSLMLDAGTLHNKKFVNVLVCCSGAAFFFRSFAVARVTGETVANVLRTTSAELSAQRVFVDAVVSDNGSSMIAGHAQAVANGAGGRLDLGDDLANGVALAGVPLVRCYAHTVQLMVHDALAEGQSLAPFADAVSTLVDWWSQVANATNMNRLQGEGALTVVKPVATRWNSTYDAACRLLDDRVRPHIALLYRGNARFDVLERGVALLKPLAVITELIQRDRTTAFEARTMVLKARADIAAQRDEPGRQRAADQLVDFVDARLASNLSSDVVSVLRLISEPQAARADVNAALVEKATALFAGWCTRRGRNPPPQELPLFLAAANREANPNPTALMDRFRADKTTAVDFFEAMLNVVASEAAVERSFSTQGWFFNKLRSRMRPGVLDDMLFVRWNHPLAFPQVHRGRKIVEERDDPEAALRDAIAAVVPEEQVPDVVAELLEAEPQPRQRAPRRRRNVLDDLIEGVVRAGGDVDAIIAIAAPPVLEGAPADEAGAAEAEAAQPEFIDADAEVVPDMLY